MTEVATNNTKSISKKEMARRNLLISFITKIAEIVLSFIGRSFLIFYLGKFYLGVNGLFSGILQMLSLAELGIGVAIIYRMYSPLANGDIQKVQVYYKVYKISYIIIGAIITLFGLCAIPLFPYLIKDYSSYSINLVPIYLIFLATTVIPYFFFSYREAILIVNQEAYIENIVFAVSAIVQYLIQIVLLYFTKNYYVYLAVSLFFMFVRHLIVSIIANKKYGDCMKKTESRLAPEERKSLAVDVVSLAMYNIGSVLMDSIDNIVISSILGIEVVGIYSNYFLITSSLSSILLTTFNSLIGTIGLYCATSVSVTEKKEMFLRTNYLVYLCYGFCTICCVSFFNVFMKTWLGVDYLLPMTDVVMICLSFFLFGSIKAVAIYEQSFGLFRYGKFRPIVMCAVKICLSFILVYSLGLAGVLLATVIAYLSTLVWWDPFVLYKYAFKEKPWPFYLRLFLETLVVSAFSFVAWIVCSKIPASGWPSTIGVLCVSILFGLAFCVAASIKSKEFSFFRGYIRDRVKPRKTTQSSQMSDGVEISEYITDKENQPKAKQTSTTKLASILYLSFIGCLVFIFFLLGVGGSGFSNSTTISTVFESITQLKKVIHGQQFYSAAFFLGSDSGAYLNSGIISPFALILCLFSQSFYSYGMLFVSLVKCVAVYYSVFWLLKVLLSDRLDSKVISFLSLLYSGLSILYGLSESFAVSDFLVIIPLACSLIITLVQKQNSKVTLISVLLYLALMVVFLWSSFYNLPITILLFFCGVFVFLIKHKISFRFGKFFSFVFFLMLGTMGISMIVWLPVLISYKSLSLSAIINGNQLDTVLSVFGFYGLSFLETPDSSIGALCLSIFIPVLVFYFLSNKRKRWTICAVSFSVLLAFAFSSVFSPLVKLVFASSSFLVVIVQPLELLTISDYLANKPNREPVKKAVVVVCCLSAVLFNASLFVLCALRHFINPFYFLNMALNAFAFAFLSVDHGISFFKKSTKIKETFFAQSKKELNVVVGLISVFCASVFSESLFTSKAFKDNELSVANNLSSDYSTARFVANDSESYSIGISSGLMPLKTESSYFSSSEEADFLNKMGFDFADKQYSTITSQSLLGVECTIGFSNQFFEQRVKSDSFEMSYNPYYFPFVYRASPKIDELVDSDNPFEYQSSIISLLCSTNQQVMTECSVVSNGSSFSFNNEGNPVYISFVNQGSGSELLINGASALTIGNDSKKCIYSLSQYLADGENNISFKKDGSDTFPAFLLYEEHLDVLKNARQSITPLDVQMKSSNNIYIPQEQWAFQREQSRIIVGALYSSKWDVRYNGLQDKTIIHNSFGLISADVPYGHFYMRFVYAQNGVQNGYSVLMCSVPLIFVAFYFLLKNEKISFLKDSDLDNCHRNVEVIEDEIRL